MFLDSLRIVLLFPMLLVSSGLTGVLAYQLHGLRAINIRLSRAATLPIAGLPIPPVWAKDLRGDSVELGAPVPGRKQVLLAFNTTCTYCKASLPAWNQIAKAGTALEPGAQVIGVSLDSADVTREYVGVHRLDFPVVLLSGIWMEAYRLLFVPAIVVIDSSGHASYARVGVLQKGESIDSVLRAIGAIADDPDPRTRVPITQ